jgi:superfamily II DNA or RNA helicase
MEEIMDKALLTIGGHLSHLRLFTTPNIDDRALETYLDDESSDTYQQYLPLSTEGTVTKLYSRTGNCYEFPSGLTHKLLKALGKPQLEVVKEVLPLVEVVPLEPPEWLRDYQREAIRQAYLHKRLHMKIPTGGGKTYIMGELARTLSRYCPVLIVVPTRQLLTQNTNSIATYLERTNSSQPLGQIGDGIYNPQAITIGILDSLTRDSEYLQSVGVVIFDECHCYANVSGCLLSKALRRTRYRIGLSATPEPGNGLSWLLESLIGPLRYEVPIERLISTEIIMQPSVEMHEAPYKQALGNLFKAGKGALKGRSGMQLLKMDYTHWGYNILYNYLIVLNQERNQLIVDLAVKYMESHPGYPLAVIVRKVNASPNHVEQLIPLFLARGYSLPVISGTTKGKVLTDVLQALRDGTIPGAICGPKTISLGTDIPNLGGLLLACAGTSSIDIIQRVGRVMRYEEGKPTPVIIDLLDGVSFFSSQSSKRRKEYEQTYSKPVQVYREAT